METTCRGSARVSGRGTCAAAMGYVNGTAYYFVLGLSSRQQQGQKKKAYQPIIIIIVIERDTAKAIASLTERAIHGRITDSKVEKAVDRAWGKTVSCPAMLIYWPQELVLLHTGAHHMNEMIGPCRACGSEPALLRTS